MVKPRRRVRAVGPIVRRRAVATGGDGEGVADEVEEAEKRLKGAYEKSLNPPSLIHMIRLEKKWEKRNPPEQPSGWARDDDGVIDLVEGEDDDCNEEDPEASGSGSEVQGKGEEEEEVAEPSTPPRRGSYVPISFIAPHTPDFGPSGSLSRDAPSTPSESPVAAGAKSRESPFYMTRRVKRRLSELEASFDFWEGRALPCADLVSGESSVRSVLARILDVKGTTSSVCYMRETESKQEGMQLRKLPHIMYRMSYLEPESPASSSARSCVEKALFPARACVIQSDDDVAYREYVMWPSRRLEMLGENDKTSCSTCMADSIAAMRRHLRENSCVILHYRYRGGRPCWRRARRPGPWPRVISRSASPSSRALPARRRSTESRDPSPRASSSRPYASSSICSSRRRWQRICPPQSSRPSPRSSRALSAGSRT